MEQATTNDDRREAHHARRAAAARLRAAVALSLASHLPAARCIASAGLGEGERALLDYYIGLRTRRLEATRSAQECDAVLIQSRTGEPGGPSDPCGSWELAWQGSRPGADTSTMSLYVRPAAIFQEGALACRFPR